MGSQDSLLLSVGSVASLGGGSVTVDLQVPGPWGLSRREGTVAL